MAGSGAGMTSNSDSSNTPLPPHIRAGLPADCDVVAAMVRELALTTSPGVVPQVTGDALRRDLFGPAPLLRLAVADHSDKLTGYCLSLFMFSTWRGTRGLHVIDLYVRPEARRTKLGEQLLVETARRGWAEGARFIRLEVERGNEGAERFYNRLGFHHKDNETLFALYADEMSALTNRCS